MTFTQQLSTQQIGKLGELFIQYRLLQLGIESAHLTTDAGIDLVAYSPRGGKALTVQVKTNLAPKPSGGKGKPSLDWWVPDDSPAELFAFVDVSENQAWIFTLAELEAHAQQHSKKGMFHLYIHLDSTIKRRADSKPAHLGHFEKFKLENCIHAHF